MAELFKIIKWVCDKRPVLALYYPMTLVPDPHAQAALMLCESLAYVLVEQGIVSKHQVIDAIEGVIEVGREIARTSEPVVVSITPIILLQDILNSIRAASEPQSPASEKRDEPRPTSSL